MRAKLGLLYMAMCCSGLAWGDFWEGPISSVPPANSGAPMENQRPNPNANNAGAEINVPLNNPVGLLKAKLALKKSKFKSFDEALSELRPLIEQTNPYLLFSTPSVLEGKVFLCKLNILQTIGHGEFILVPPPEMESVTFFHGAIVSGFHGQKSFSDDESVEVIGVVKGQYQYYTAAWHVLKTVPNIKILAIREFQSE